MSETQPSQAVALVSGGLDSTTLVYWLIERGTNVIPLFLDYGQHCRTTERETLASVIPHELAECVQTLDISAIYTGSRSRLIDEANLWTDRVSSAEMYLPYRNLLFLSVAAAFAQSHEVSHVYTAFINSNHAIELDCSSEFFGRLTDMLSDYGSVQIEMPFRNNTKAEVALLAHKLGVPIGLTYSCQISASTPCGACPNCVERLEAVDSLLNRTTEELL
jgi:7-cyano-7-deazaguanine synthase